MAIFVIGDLHLSFQEYKPMSIFGTNWEKHEEKIRKDWMQKVTQNDLVVLPGDFSWAMHLKDTQKDFIAEKFDIQDNQRNRIHIVTGENYLNLEFLVNREETVNEPSPV